MSVIHLFNPQNDLALANGSPNFTAPKAAVDLACAGACLPMWYGQPGDCFFGAVNDRWFTNVSQTFSLAVEPTIRPRAGYGIEPWGWSAATRCLLENMGVSSAILPDKSTIEAWREFSSRVASAPVLSSLMAEVPSLVDGRPDAFAPRIATDVDEAMDIISTFGGRAMLKLPWSNAGRGQQDTARTTPDELLRRVGGMIARQGAIEISPYYDGILDFAMLFDVNGFVGYSLFTTDTHGGWLENRLLSDTDIEELIMAKAATEVDFEVLRSVLSRLVAESARKVCYAGPSGVDFMVAKAPDGSIVIPPVEINRRRTMGHVAHTLKQNILAPGVEGSFAITPRGQAGYADNYRTSGMRLVEGILNLVPPGGAFDITLSVR